MLNKIVPGGSANVGNGSYGTLKAGLLNHMSCAKGYIQKPHLQL